jgi:serine/threonine-protein kinase
MDGNRAPCPDETTLLEYVAGRLPPPARDELIAHFQSCQLCEETVALLISSTLPAAPRAPHDDGVQRFELVQLLGSGGGGDVYRAYDRRLQRTVALKLLRSDGRRFLLEAQAQARVDHPNICKVFEIGMRGERPFIAMQYVAGRTIGAVAAEITLAERLRVLADVAAAVAAAHAQGIVHRDLKPSNIMVERTATGEWKPYVMDFGLARELSRDSVTESGVLVGTPMFMAPEQARGDGQRCDARTDVFGLGMTMYSVLVGRAPFVVRTATEALTAVLKAEPIPPRRIDPRFPADVQTILLKCLEKMPARRYESAAVLAQDLDLYLRGEPIRATPVRFVGRWSRRVRRHPRRAVLAALALATAALLGAFEVRARLSAAAHAELWRQLGEKAPQLKAQLRNAYLLPIHDVRAERQAVRLQMKQLEMELAHQHDVATTALVEYALGEAHLALREDEPALALLERAWAAGRRGADLDTALGRALTDRYVTEIEAARKIGDATRRKQRMDEIVARFRDPALSHLRAAVGTSDASPAYLEALILYDQERYADAAARAHQAFAAAPTQYEAGVLEANAQLWLGADAWNAGKQAEADQLFATAQATFARVIDVARSDDHVYLAKAFALLKQQVVHTDRGEIGVMPELDRAIEDARRIDPDNVAPLAMEAQVYGNQALMLFQRGGDFGPPLAKAFALVDEDLAHNPNEWNGYSAKCKALFVQTMVEARGKKDSSATIDRMIDVCAQFVKLNPIAPAYGFLANAYLSKADRESESGRDPEVSFAAAVHNYREAIAISPETEFIGNLGSAFVQNSDYEVAHDLDPNAEVTAGLETLNRALTTNRTAAMPRFSVGHLLLVQATYEAAHGKDPRASLARARKELLDGIAINHAYAAAFAYLVDADMVEAEFLMQQNQDPTAILNSARARVQKLERDFPTLRRDEGARVALLAARWQSQRGEPALALAAARAALLRACRQPCEDVRGLTLRAELELASAEDARVRHRSAAEAIARGAQLAAQALARDPRFARALKVKAALERLRD